MNTTQSNYYEVLDVSEAATPEEIRKAYILLTKKYHPDTTSLPLNIAHKKMSEINKAYAVLSNSKSRESYDLHYSEDPDREKP
ncbi:MAG: DnaJ domain-containing protein [Dialister sp.]|nr:DnaJ domain-containing protein [Dialister sp.]